MTDSWDARTLARHLLGVLPRFGRAMAQRTQALSDEDDTTLAQGLTLLALHQEMMTVSDLARRRHVSLQSASKLVQGLVERGWVTRVRKADDRRQYLLEVTDKGKAHTKDMQALFVAQATQLLNGLTVDEIAAAQIFLPALERMLDRLGAPAPEHPVS